MMAKLFALLNHPVTQAIIDTGQYAIRMHIIPAVNRNSAPPTQEEVHETAGEYATFSEEEFANSEVVETNSGNEEKTNETSAGKTEKRSR